MTLALVLLAIASAVAVPRIGHTVKRIWTAPPPPYCNEQMECCLKKEDCSILGILPAERR